MYDRTMTPVMSGEEDHTDLIRTEFDYTIGYTPIPQQHESYSLGDLCHENTSRSYLGSKSSLRKGVRPQSTMQMLSDAVYKKEVARLSAMTQRPTNPTQRPSSADMTLYHRPSSFNPYQTTYTHEYYKKEGEDRSARPWSHIGLSSAPLRDETTYKKQYTGKRTTTNKTFWSGGNNPHPSQAFMIWQYPTKKLEELKSASNTEVTVPSLTNEKFDKVMRGKSKSTYQVDYKGLPPGYMPTEYVNVEKDWKSSIPYTLDSLQRVSYQNPNQAKPLSNKTDRYGHSTNDRHRLLVGIAPNASQRKATVNNKTTYHRHFNENAGLIQQAAGIHFPNHARAVVKGKGPEELSALYEEIKRLHYQKHSQSAAASLNGFSNELPIVAPDSGVPQVSPGAGINPIPAPCFNTTPVPEPICEPV